MKNIWLIVIGVLAIINVVYTFIEPSGTYSIFSIKMNIWLYRLIWSAAAVQIFYEYNKRQKNN